MFIPAKTTLHILVTLLRLNEAKCFSSEIFQNYLVFMPAETTLHILVTLPRLIVETLMKCQKKRLKI